MRYLALDTSSGIKVLLTVDGKNYDYVADDGKMASATLLPTIDRLLTKAGVTIEMLDAIAVVIGPGSFTGIRIAVNTARALSYVTRVPLIGIDALTVGAYGVKEDCHSVIYGWGKNFYVAEYEGRKMVKEACIMQKEDVLALAGTVVCDRKSKRFIANGTECNQVTAIRKIVRQRLKKGEMSAFEDVIPYYIAVSQAEKDLENK